MLSMPLTVSKIISWNKKAETFITKLAIININAYTYNIRSMSHKKIKPQQSAKLRCTTQTCWKRPSIKNIAGIAAMFRKSSIIFRDECTIAHKYLLGTVE